MSEHRCRFCPHVSGADPISRETPLSIHAPTHAPTGDLNDRSGVLNVTVTQMQS